MVLERTRRKETGGECTTSGVSRRVPRGKSNERDFLTWVKLLKLGIDR